MAVEHVGVYGDWMAVKKTALSSLNNLTLEKGYRQKIKDCI